MAVPVPNNSSLQTALRSFLLSVVPAGVEVIEGQDSRVSEPSSTDFIIMTPILRSRLETNFVAWADVAFTGSISGTTLTVSSMQFGTILPGSTLWGINVAAGTTIISGPGGVGSYVVSVAQSLAPQTLAAGNITLAQPVQVTMQLDIHSANVADAADMAATISTLFRSEIGTNALEAVSLNFDPLYADEPRQVPFQNAEQQWESRWVVDAVMQTTQVVTWPMQFMGAASVTIYPPPV